MCARGGVSAFAGVDTAGGRSRAAGLAGAAAGALALILLLRRHAPPAPGSLLAIIPPALVAALGGLPQMPHGKPDWKNASFGLFIGAAPAQSGNPFQRQGRVLADLPTADFFNRALLRSVSPQADLFLKGELS